MSRSIRVIGVGVAQTTGRPWVRGVVDFTELEGRQAYEMARDMGAQIPPAAFGMVNGLPEQAAAKLKPGDVVTADEVTIRLSRDTFTDKVSGEERHGVSATIYVAGKASRTAAPVAECDW